MNTTDDYVAYVPSGWDAKWVSNSFGVTIWVDDFTKCIYAILGVSVVIMLHSFYLGGYKYRTVRICAEITTMATMGQAISYLSCTNYEADDYYSGNACNLRTSAYLFDLFCVGILGFSTQLCDNYIVFNRYVVITEKVSIYHKIAVGMYAVIILYGSWWLYYTFLPWVDNLNSVTVLYWSHVTQGFVLMIGYILYDLFYTGLVLRKLLKLLSNTDQNSSRKSALKILAIKTIIHNLISAASIVGYIYWLEFGVIWYNLCTMVSLHCCFNWKVEKMFQRQQPKTVNGLSRASSYYESGEGDYQKRASLIGTIMFLFRGKRRGSTAPSRSSIGDQESRMSANLRRAPSAQFLKRGMSASNVKKVAVEEKRKS